MCNTSFASCKYAWFLDTGMICHMYFWRDFFKELNTNIDVMVYFADRSYIKPSGINTIRLKLPSLPDMILLDVLYLPKLWRNVLSLMLIHQQGHSIHMFNGIVEIRSSYDNKVMMIGKEDEKLLKLHGDFTKSRNFAYLTHQEKGTL